MRRKELSRSFSSPPVLSPSTRTPLFRSWLRRPTPWRTLTWPLPEILWLRPRLKSVLLLMRFVYIIQSIRFEGIIDEVLERE